MASYDGTLSAFQGILSKFDFEKIGFDENTSFGERFAVKRFKKKFQVPDNGQSKERKQKCWSDWLSFDQSLRKLNLAPCTLRRELWLARNDLQKVGSVRFNTYDLPKGSEFDPTNGLNSIESRLSRSTWTCTYDNFERFSDFVYGCKAMKRAFRKRYTQMFHQKFPNDNQNQCDKMLWRRLAATSLNNLERGCFDYKLQMVIDFVQGSRFSTVPKNNEVDRPINVEALGNIVVQRQIGNFLRDELKRLYSVDLDNLAQRHRKMITAKVATIDLKNASDSITVALCKLLLPRRLFAELMKSRSEFILGLDEAYHPLQKISSMGNGFTFELMTLILTAVVRRFDPQGSVFGDDIICRRDVAADLIELLEHIGFVINREKSFIEGPFRESCGANYHDVEGYIESFDFRWPLHVHDCIVIYNKALRLSRSYPSFERLRCLLHRHTPQVLQGPPEHDFFEKEMSYKDGSDATAPAWLSTFFRVCENIRGLPEHREKVKALQQCYQVGRARFKFHKGLTYVDALLSPTKKDLTQDDWSKFEMYLHAGRRAKDFIRGQGDWVECLLFSYAGATTRWSDSYVK